MATEQEQIDAIKALPETKEFYAGQGARRAAGDGEIVTRTWIFEKPDGSTGQRNIQLYVASDGTTYIHNSPDITSPEPDARLNAELVLQKVTDGIPGTVSITREGFNERVRLLVSTGQTTTEWREYLVTFNPDGSYASHKHITNVTQ